MKKYFIDKGDFGFVVSADEIKTTDKGHVMYRNGEVIALVPKEVLVVETDDFTKPIQLIEELKELAEHWFNTEPCNDVERRMPDEYFNVVFKKRRNDKKEFDAICKKIMDEKI